MAFCPSVFELSSWFWFASLFMGALVGEVDFGDLEANLFLQCSSCGKVDFVDLETRFVCFPFDGCPRWWGRFRWPWGKFIFCSALLVVKSISLTLRHVFVSFWWPSYGVVDFVDFEVVIYFLHCTSFGGVDRFDPEARICFLQCTYFNGVDHFDPEARVYFLQCAYFSGVGLFDPEASVYFLQWITLWHPDSGLVGSCCCR